MKYCADRFSDLSLFDRAKREADIVLVYGGTLYGQRNKRRGPCPLCGNGKGKKTGHAFEVDIGRNTWRCYSCDEPGGSVIDLEHLLHSKAGETIVDAARRLVGDTPMRAERVQPEPVLIPEGESFAERFASQILKESVPATNTLVGRYLMNRGIFGKVLIGALKVLRFHPRVYHSGPASNPRTYPAMIAQVVVPDLLGNPIPTGGIHVTYLARDGSGKAHVPEGEKAKKMWGPQHLNGLPGGVWLGPVPDAGSDQWTVVAEGIETALSVAILHNEPCFIGAALSLGRLQGGWQGDKYGRYNPDLPTSDPERPAFTWPGARRVLIGLDHDMSPIRVRVRKPHGGTGQRILGPTERARLCGALAKAAWGRAGADTVRSLAPDLGDDFNDRLRREQVA